ncbi:hypothetical protein RBH89_23145 [Paracidovorax avenae]
MLRKLPTAKFLSGKIVEKGAYVFSSRLDVLPEGAYDHARISGYRGGEFVFQDRDMQIESICIRRETVEEPLRSTCLLPRFNSVVGFYQKGGDQYDEVLPPSPSPGGGVMGQLRLIDGILYAAGTRGCISKRVAKNNWVALNRGMNVKGASQHQAEGASWSEALTLAGAQPSTNTINGKAGRVFCAGDEGEVFFLRRDEWVRVESNTNAVLTDIQIDPQGDAYVCGWKGTLLVGSEKGFKPIVTNIDDYFKTMAFFNGQLYIGGAKGIYKLEGGTVRPVSSSQIAPFNCVELDSYGGELLVVSDRWFLLFDGAQWQRVDNPDNTDIAKP